MLSRPVPTYPSFLYFSRLDYLVHQMKGHQLEGQRRSNEFLLKRVEELEMQIARISGAPRVPPVGTD